MTGNGIVAGDNGTVARWEDYGSRQREHVVLTSTHGLFRAESIFLSAGDSEAFGVHYKLVCSPTWALLQFEAHLIGSDRKLVLSKDTSGIWRNEDHVELKDLAGAIDIDLSISPFTNTLPIRRLNLAKNESAEITVAYVSFPEMKVFADLQRYTRIGEFKYLFESVDTEFRAEFEVDKKGLVMNYPNMFLRIL